MSDDRRFEPDHIYDLPPLSPSADHLELLEHQQREDQWRRTREPVAAGSKFLKFLTWQDLVNLKLVTEEQVIGSDDPSKPDEPGGPGDDEIDDPKVYAYARDFDPSTNDGASSPLVISFGSGKPDAKVIAFDPAVNESAEIQLILPPEWPGKSLQARIYWSHGLATSWGVVWEVQAHSAKDGENMAVDYVGGMIATDEGGDTNHLYISASNVVTIETGNAMPGDLVLIKLIRRTDHEDDTLDGDAYFHAIEFLIGESPAAFPEIVEQPTIVGSIYADNAADIAIPAHEAGDLILLVYRAPAAFPAYATPSTYSGFTSLLAADDMGFVSRYRVQWKIDTDNSFTSMAAVAGPYHALVVIIRGASGIGATAMTKGDNVGPPATIPGLTLTETSGTSLVLAGVVTNQGYALTDPTAHTLVESNPGLGGGENSMWVYDGTTSSYAGASVPWTGGAYWTAFALEILA